MGKNIIDYQSDEIDKVLNVNIKGYIYFSQMFARILFHNERKGVIVNMSSVSGMEGSSDAVYGLSKAPVMPEDVAETVIFLLSAKSRHYTGATFDINNGGYLR